MSKNKTKIRRGVTLVELMITTVIASIAVLSIGVLIVDGQRGWNTMYRRINADVVSDGYAARRMFDSTIRKASADKLLLDTAGNWIEVYYYADANSTVTDRYARFYYTSGGDRSDGTLNLEYGDWNSTGTEPRQASTTQRICSNVTYCVFKAAGRSAQMICNLDNGEQSTTIASSAVMQN